MESGAETPERTVGNYLSAPLAISSAVGNAMAAAIETVMQKRGMSLLDIRILCNWLGCGTQVPHHCTPQYYCNH
jgi:hypothetical protein